jgi:hypothetical protein
VPKVVAKKIDDTFKEFGESLETQLASIHHLSPIYNSSREEAQHSLELIDGLFDKILDLSKLLIAVSVPALVTLYSINNESFRSGPYILMTALALIAGISLFIVSICYKQKYLLPFLKASNARMDTYRLWIEAESIRSKNISLERKYQKLTRKE